MKITKSYLRQVIREEIEKINETPNNSKQVRDLLRKMGVEGAEDASEAELRRLMRHAEDEAEPNAPAGIAGMAGRSREYVRGKPKGSAAGKALGGLEKANKLAGAVVNPAGALLKLVKADPALAGGDWWQQSRQSTFSEVGQGNRNR